MCSVCLQKKRNLNKYLSCAFFLIFVAKRVREGEGEERKMCSYMSIDRFNAIKMKLNTIHPYIGTARKTEQANKKQKIK